MAILSLRNFGILLIAQVVLGVPWSARPAARYEGYDLERGPVLYEAYYPEEEDVEGESPNIYQEKRYFDRISVPERSYQIPADPYEMPYEPEETDIRKEYVPSNAGYLSAFTATRPLTVQKRGYNGNDQRKREYIFTDQAFNGQPSQDRAKSWIGNDYPLARSQSSDYGNRNEGEADFAGENHMNFGDLEVQRIVPINDEFIFGEPAPMKKLPNFEESLRNLNEKEVNFDGQNFGTDSYHNQRKEIKPLEPMENIFEPRPQTINYVFSAPQNKMEKLKPVDFESESDDSNDWPRNYGDNIIQTEIKKADEQELKNEEAKIASIEVSQVSHHKIRHHHGELPKRKYVRK